MELKEVIEQRRSIKQYDPNATISDAELAELIGQTIKSPSSFNLQHWRFIVVRDPERKKALCKLSWNQQQVEQASATILIIGDLKAHRAAGDIYADAPQPIRDALVPMISGTYQGKPEFQRDEAIRSGSLAAMTLMLTAEDMGFSTCPMIGFDPEAVSEFLELDAQHIPVMMITVGKKAAEARNPSPRFPLSKVVMLEKFGGPSLSA